MTRWRILRACTLVAALGVMVVLVARLGPRRIADEVISAGPESLWLLVAYSAGTALGAAPWCLLLAELCPGWRAAIASRFAASGANALVPLLGFGGEPVRLLWLPAADRAAGVAAIVLDRLLYAAASALFLIAGAIAALRLARLPSTYALIGGAGAVLLFVGSAVAIWLTARHRLADRFHRLIDKVQRRSRVEGVGFGEHVDQHIAAILRRRRRIVLALLVHILGRIVLGSEVYVGFRVLDVPLSIDEAIAFATIPVLLSFIGAIVPSQVGIQEATQALVASAIGIPAHAAVAVVLLQRIRQVVTMAIAWLLIATHRSRARSAAASTALAEDEPGRHDEERD